MKFLGVIMLKKSIDLPSHFDELYELCTLYTNVHSTENKVSEFV